MGADVYSLIPWSTPLRTSTNSATAITWRPRELRWIGSSTRWGCTPSVPFRPGKATWILNYSWDGDKKVDRREAMKNLAMSQMMAGANFWDAPGHSMARIKRSAYPEENFHLDQGARENFLFTPHSHLSRRRLLLSRRPAITMRKISSTPTGTSSYC